MVGIYTIWLGFLGILYGPHSNLVLIRLGATLDSTGSTEKEHMLMSTVLN